MQLGVQGAPTAQQALRPAWANCVQCPRAQPGWHTFATAGRSGPCAVVLVCLLLERLARECGCGSPRAAGVCPGPALPAPPGQGKRLGVPSVENPGYPGAKKDHIRRLTLLLLTLMSH